MSTVHNALSTYRSTAISASAPLTGVATAQAVEAPASPAEFTAAGDSVQISGRATMLNRLFGGNTEAEPKSPYGPQPSSGVVYDYLTGRDREALSTFYDIARDRGIDLVEVDNIAFDLGSFRSVPPGVTVDSVGTMFDIHGEPMMWDFSPDDEATAQRILTSRAVNDSALPEDFLRHRLDSGWSPGGASNFSVLEELVYATSSSGANGETNPAAVLAPRPRQRLELLQAAGAVPTPAQVLKDNGKSAEDPQDHFAAHAARLGHNARHLTKADKEQLGSLYAATADAFGPDSPQMRDIDRLAHTLDALRATGEDETLNLWKLLLEGDEDKPHLASH